MATNQSRVELIVDAVKALNPLRAVKRASNRAEEAIDRLRAAARKTGSTLEDLGNKGKRGLGQLAAEAGRAAAKFGKLGKAAIVAAAVAGSAALAKFSFGAAGELERQTKSLQVLTGSLETAKGIIAELQAFGAVTPFTSQELIETSKRLKAFGFETEQIVDVTKRLADVAGATGADLGGIATAFGQIQAKGRLQTEELLQLQERGVGIADELQKMYGMTGEQFSKALEKGQISAKAAEVALIRLTDKGGKYANGAIAQSDTLFGKLSTLQDALQRFGQNIGKVLSPIFKGIIDFLTTITNQINNLFREAAISNQARKNLGLQGRLSREDIKRLRAEEDRLRAASPVTTAKAPTAADLITTPELLKGRAGAGAAKPQKTAAERAVEAAQEQLANLRDQVELGRARTDDEREMLELNQQIRDIEALRGVIGNELADNLIQQHRTLHMQGQVKDHLAEQDKRRAEAARKLKEQQDKQLEQLKQMGQVVKDGIVDGIMSAIDGSKSLGESLSGILRQLGGMFIQAGVGDLGRVLRIPGFANGGQPPVGRASIVGERGPELFVPRRAGTIIPNHEMGGGVSVNVNVDAGGSNVEGSADQAGQLGKAIGLAVQQELIKQKRPGGLLA